MKKYDFKKAKELITNTPNVTEAKLGMHEDWFWTAETVYENGEFVIDLDDEDVVIAGIIQSSWATPTLNLVFSDGSDAMIEVSIGKNTSTKKDVFHGTPFSIIDQDDITPLNINEN